MKMISAAVAVGAVIISCTLAGATIAAGRGGDGLPQAITDRVLIRELMDRYGIVHDFGSPKDYADIFTSDAEISVGGRVVVKGREALIAMAERDHERYSEKRADGSTSSIMRHIISNAQITLTGPGRAAGICYVTTIVQKSDVGPAILSVGRYRDEYEKVDGEWRIARRTIIMDFGNQALGKSLGFGS